MFPLQNKDIRRILIIRLRNIGDVLLMVPTLRAFREGFPHASITALVNRGTEEMLTGNPVVDEVMVFDPRWKTLPLIQRLAREFGLIREVRRRRFDLAVNLTEGDRGAFLCLGSGAPHRVGVFHEDSSLWWKKRVFHHLVRIPDGRAHMVEQMLETARYLGLPIRDRQVEIFFSPEDRFGVEERLRKHGVSAGERIVHIHPTSRWLFKCWRDEAVARVIDALQEGGFARVVLTSGSERRELEKIQSIQRRSQTKAIDLSGKMTLKQLAALSQRADLFIGVDTAPMHIAAAVKTPVIALFGPSGEFNWGPWGDAGHVVIKKDWPCRPCGKDGCEGSKRSRCLEEIREEEVLAHAFRILESGPRKEGGEDL